MRTLAPFLKTMEKNFEYRYPSVIADSGYESEEVYTYLREQKQKSYITPQIYEKWKKRSKKGKAEDGFSKKIKKQKRVRIRSNDI